MPDPAPAAPPNPFRPPARADAGLPESNPEGAARTAGRGGAAIAVAKVSFILFGFAQQLILPYLVGVDGYGQLRRVFGAVGIINNVVVGAAIQGVSHAVSSAPDEAASAQAFRRTLRIHAVLAVVLSLGFALFAGPFADFVSAPHVASPLRVVALVVLLYGIYAPLVGSLNGRRRFIDQAGLDIGYGAIRLLAVAAGALAFIKVGLNGVMGAAGGFAVAAAVIVPIALWRSGTGKAGPLGPTTGGYLAYLGPLAAGQFFLNVLIQADALLLSRFVGQAAESWGHGRAAADRLVAGYAGAQLFALLSYQLLISISFVLFPMLARAASQGDRAAVASYTATGVRLGLLIAGLVCGTISALAPHLLRVVFPPAIAEDGAEALHVLALGMGAFAMMGISCAALSALKRERVSALLTAFTLLLISVACTIAVPRASFGPAMLTTSAAATSCALGLGAVAAGFMLRWLAGAFVSGATLLRVLVALAAAVGLGSHLPWLGGSRSGLMSRLYGGAGLVGEAILVAAIYLGILVALREIGRHDLASLRSAFGRRA